MIAIINVHTIVVLILAVIFESPRSSTPKRLDSKPYPGEEAVFWRHG